MQQRAINLTFHGIGEPGPELEPGEAELWVSRERFNSLLDAVADRGDVRITFDDGNASDLEHALPALRERGLTATFFVVAGRLGTPRFLGPDGVSELSAAGMRIGCHGMRHRPWRGLDAAALHEELVESRAVLERIIERPVSDAACPFGTYDRRVLRKARSSGYRLLFTSDRGTARADQFVQARNSVVSGDAPDLLGRIAALEGAPHRLLRRRTKQAVKRWR